MRAGTKLCRLAGLHKKKMTKKSWGTLGPMRETLICTPSIFFVRSVVFVRFQTDYLAFLRR